MTKTFYAVVVVFVLLIAGLVVYELFVVDEEPADVACPSVATERYSEEELHEAYVMTRGMSRDDAAPMWHDAQLERALTDPVFVAELEAHFCRMRQMVARP